MPATPLRRIYPALLLALAAGAGAEPLKVRPGGWDMTMSVSINGGAPKIHPLKSCVTKEDLERDQAFQKDEDCEHKISARTSTRLAGTVSCKSDGVQSRGEFEVLASTPESITLKMSSKGSTPKSGTVESRTEVKGRWASASCKGYDD